MFCTVRSKRCYHAPTHPVGGCCAIACGLHAPLYRRADPMREHTSRRQLAPSSYGTGHFKCRRGRMGGSGASRGGRGGAGGAGIGREASICGRRGRSRGDVPLPSAPRGPGGRGKKPDSRRSTHAWTPASFHRSRARAQHTHTPSPHPSRPATDNSLCRRFSHPTARGGTCGPARLSTSSTRITHTWARRRLCSRI